MRLVSNVADTRFRVRERGIDAAPDEGWRVIGTGSQVEVRLRTGRRYEVAAQPAGYRERRVQLSEPVPRYEFRFLSTDREYAGGSRPNTSTQRPAPEPGRTGSGGRSWAVVVGVSRHAHSGPGGLGELAFADNDARDFRRSLLELGWEEDHIRLLLDEHATKRDIEYALETWLRRSGPEDLIVLFWAGHGWPDAEDTEKAYFAAYDSRPSDPSSGVRMDHVRRVVDERKFKNVVFIADTCHSGKVIRSADPRDSSVVPALESMRRRKTIPQGWVFITSADSDRKAYEDKTWNNGALTHVILEALAGMADGYQSVGRHDGRVTLAELRTYITDRMREESLNVIGARLEPFFYTTSGDTRIWQITLDYP